MTLDYLTIAHALGYRPGQYPKQRLRDKAKELKVPLRSLSYRADGRIEWHCGHGVGHTVYGEGTHGCDGCCGRFRKKK